MQKAGNIKCDKSYSYSYGTKQLYIRIVFDELAGNETKYFVSSKLFDVHI